MPDSVSFFKPDHVSSHLSRLLIVSLILLIVSTITWRQLPPWVLSEINPSTSGRLHSPKPTGTRVRTHPSPRLSRYFICFFKFHFCKNNKKRSKTENLVEERKHCPERKPWGEKPFFGWTKEENIKERENREERVGHDHTTVARHRHWQLCRSRSQKIGILYTFAVTFSVHCSVCEYPCKSTWLLAMNFLV